MPSTLDSDLRTLYEIAEQEYLRSLPLEHFMEATAQATQRKITLESFDLIHVKRPDVQCFNELLVQYPRGGDVRKPVQVVPDNMVVIHSEPIVADGSYNTPLQPVGPFLVLEYVSKESNRKEYEESFFKYEHQLKVPYYLVFHPEKQDLAVFRHSGTGYLKQLPNSLGRLAIPDLDLEAAIHEEWVRFWYQGELLPLPRELLKQLEARDELLEQKDELLEQKDELLEQKDRLLAAASSTISKSEDELKEARERLQTEMVVRAGLEAEIARMREDLARARGEN